MWRTGSGRMTPCRPLSAVAEHVPAGQIACPAGVFFAREARGLCARRAGRLLGGSTAFFAKKAVGKKAQRGDTPLWTPPKRSPAFILLRRYFQSAAWPIPGFPPIRKALYPANMGRPPKKAALLEGSGEGNEKFPSPPFLSPVSFPRKEIGRCPRRTPARRGQIPPDPVRASFTARRPPTPAGCTRAPPERSPPGSPPRPGWRCASGRAAPSS